MSIKIVATGDLHFGNPKISSEKLYVTLTEFFYKEAQTSDLILLTGDLFDQIATVNSNANKYVSLFIRELFLFSARLGIPVRILHGTYSHDRNQLSVLEVLKLENTNAKIINEISCEEIQLKDKKFRILYIPDNLPYKKSSDVMTHIKKVMSVHGWKTVDIVLGHGTFDHALPVGPEHAPPCTYTRDQFNDILERNGIIIMGHIHIPSAKNGVYYCGSFERMSHGEEQPKGFCSFEYENEQWKHKFIENPSATLFVSIYPEGYSTDEIIVDFDKQIDNIFPEHKGYVRVLHNDPEVRALLSKVCNSKYPLLTYSSKARNDSDKPEIQITDIDLSTFEDIKPSRENLAELITQFLQDSDMLGDLDLNIVNKYLDNVIEV